MTDKDRMDLLRRAIAETSQADVARRIGRSAAAINQIIKGSYSGNPEAILELVAAEYGNDVVDCPVMGEVALSQCLESRNRPFSAANPTRVKLYKACRACAHNPSREARI